MRHFEMRPTKVTVFPGKFGFVVMTNHRSDLYSLLTDYAMNIFVLDDYERNYEREGALIYKPDSDLGVDSTSKSSPLHNVDEYVGKYKHQVYGYIGITKNNENDLIFSFNDFRGTLKCLGFDNFETTLIIGDIKDNLKLNFETNIEGKIDKIKVSLESQMPISSFIKEK